MPNSHLGSVAGTPSTVSASHWAVLLVSFRAPHSGHQLTSGYGIGQIKGALASWRYEFLIVGAVCAAWGIAIFLLLPNSPASFRGFTHDERLMMIARMRKNQTGIEHRKINMGQVKETVLDYKTYMFFFLGFIANIPNGGISNVSVPCLLLWRSTTNQ